MPIDLYPNIAKIERNGAYQNLPGFVQQSGDADIEVMIANKETSTTAQFTHAKDSFFILNDILYQADANISVNGTIAVGTNCHVAILGDEILELINETTSQSEKIDELKTELNSGKKTYTYSKTYLSTNRYSTNRIYNADQSNIGKKFSDIYSAQTINAFACFIDVTFSEQITYPISVNNTYGYLAFDADDICVWVKKYPANTGWTTGDEDTVTLPISATKFLFVATNDLNNLGTDFTVTVKRSDAINTISKLDVKISDVSKSVGNIYRGGFSVNANSTHSSANDKIFVNIPANQPFLIGFDANAYGASNLVMLYATKSDNTSVNIANMYLGTRKDRIFELTADYDIIAIGAYYQNDTAVKVNVNIFISWKNAEIDLLSDSYNKSINNETKIGNIWRTEFSVNASSFHSSVNDRMIVSIPANTEFVIGWGVSNSDSTSVMQFFGVRADGGADVNFYNLYPSIKTEKFFKASVAYDLKAVGIAYNNTLAEATHINAILAFNQPDIETLCDVENEYRFAEVAIDSNIQDLLSNYADTTNSDTFAFFTDPHYLMNNGNMTLAQINSIATEWLEKVRLKENAINAQTVICCGDVLNDTDTDEQACYKLAMNDAVAKMLFGKKYHMALGNHDSKFDALDQDIIDNMLYAEEDTQKAYFSVKTPKTVYYYLNSGTDQVGTMDTYRWSQVAWLADKLGSGTDANRIVIMHIVSTASSADNFGSSIVPLAENVIDLIEAYNAKGSVTLNGQTYNFSTATGKVRCILCGHTHYDKVYVTENNLPIVCTMNTTSFGNSFGMTFDLGFLDYDNDTLYLYRTGEGSNRTVTLA